MKLCIVRHGETAWNAEGRVQGQLDIPLSATGEAQARAVARALAHERFDAVYSSDLLRVRQTAQPTVCLLGKEIVHSEKLRERHYGIFQGILYSEAKVRFAEDFVRFRTKDPHYDFQTGESLLNFQKRVFSFIDDLVQRHPAQSVLVFTHGGVLEVLYRHATGRGLATPRDFEIPNAALNRFEHRAGAWVVESWADLSHLAAALDDLPDG